MTACDGEVLKYCLSYMGPYTLVSDHINFATQIPDPRHAVRSTDRWTDRETAL